VTINDEKAILLKRAQFIKNSLNKQQQQQPPPTSPLYYNNSTLPTTNFPASTTRFNSFVSTFLLGHVLSTSDDNQPTSDSLPVCRAQTTV
jgi:hypothetical protein